MKLVKDDQKTQELLNVKAFINLMKSCPDNLITVEVDRIILETMIELIEVANDRERS